MASLKGVRAANKPRMKSLVDLRRVLRLAAPNSLFRSNLVQAVRKMDKALGKIPDHVMLRIYRQRLPKRRRARRKARASSK